MDINAIQSALKAAGLDGWLFYDFHNRDAIAARILGLDYSKMTTRRWYYFIPTEGTPKKLVHKIEPWRIDALSGEKYIYLPWQQQHSLLKQILGNSKKVAMQYSPFNAIPYVSIVDGGTIELVRSFGVDVISSADLVSIFESHLSMDDYKSHCAAGKIIQDAKDISFLEISKRIKNGENPTEYEIHIFMKNYMLDNGLKFDDGPIVAINEHAADPHFEPTPENCLKMKEGDLVLFDQWAKLNKPGSIYYDVTWMGYIGTTVPEKIENLFHIDCQARDAALNLVRERFSNNVSVHGMEVDDACRQVIIDAGYADAFIHRTGHNIAEEVHGNGTHIDNLETKDERLIIKGSCFSVEPGIYLPEEKIGFRTEIDVFVTDEGNVEVYGPIQEKVIPILNL